MPQVNCPTCQTPLEWSPANPWRPFCCERCKLIDLGEWASGERAIPGPALTESDLGDDELWSATSNPDTSASPRTRH